MDSRKALLSLFERPYDPLQQPRAGGTVVFRRDGDPPPAVSTRFGGPAPAVLNVGAGDDDLGTATLVPRGQVFSLFVRAHRRAARDLCQLFMRTRTGDELVQVAARCHGKVNESLFIYALSFTVIRKRDLRGFRLPSLVEVFPGRFVPQGQLMEAQQQRMRNPDTEEPMIIEHGPEFASTVIKPEHRLSYWREDYGINVHHWHWHVVFPIEQGINRDRKGEIFYYMHQQMIARYDIERLSVGLARVATFDNWRAPIPDGYFSKLTVNNSGMPWGTRQDDTVLKDFKRNDFGLSFQYINECELWRTRIFDAIHQGFLMDRDGNKITLTDDVPEGTKRGIDVLGDALEADGDLSPNYQFYGDLHNILHVLSGFPHDPDFAHKEAASVMADPATTMRDPLFYRLHKFVDDVFQEYKLTLPPYTENDLFMPGVKIERAGILRGNVVDNLVTGWNMRQFEAGRGLDFAGPRPVMLNLTHLDHEAFNYHMQVNNAGSRPRDVTVRIFMAPRDNIRGQAMPLSEQRILWLEMDKFHASLKPGNNHIVRSSLDSSITTTEELTFRALETTAEVPTPASDDGFCGCGWPQHMLLPRGKPEGMSFQMFFMLTDYQQDKVEQPAGTGRCSRGVSFCGIQDAKFPDKRPMGFPFDRRIAPMLRGTTVTNIQDFVQYDNMFLHEISINFTDRQLSTAN